MFRRAGRRRCPGLLENPSVKAWRKTLFWMPKANAGPMNPELRTIDQGGKDLGNQGHGGANIHRASDPQVEGVEAGESPAEQTPDVPGFVINLRS